MKVRLLYIYLFLTTSIPLFSQNNAVVNYIVLPKNGSLEKNEEILKSKVSNSFIGVDEELKRLDFELLINDSISYFHLKSSISVNEKAARLARTVAGHNEYFRNNYTNKLIIIKDLMGEKNNILVDSLLRWETSNETKNINGYKCYKATTKKTFRLKKKNKQIDVVAWYCPKISLNFGPKEYGNLPGLILELEEDKIIYFANKIVLNYKEIIKIKEVKGKTISEHEYSKKIEETYLKNLEILQKE